MKTCSLMISAMFRTHRCQLLSAGKQITHTARCHCSYFPKSFYSTGIISDSSYTRCLSVGVHSSLPLGRLRLINPKKAKWKLGLSVVLLLFFFFLTLSYCLNCRDPAVIPKHLNYGNVISQKSKNK